MNELVDKILLFLFSITLFLFQDNSSIIIVPMILTIILCSLFAFYEDDRLKLAGNILFALLCVFQPDYIIFLPVLLYDIFHMKYQAAISFLPFLYIYHFTAYTPLLLSFTSVIAAVSYLLKLKTYRFNTIKSEYNDLRDSSAQMSLMLEEKTQSLLKNQDNEINLATLNERNRISRELHDSIGHLLSRSILQVGALLTISKDGIVSEGLTALKESLSDGMDQIRSSIHNMYDDSIDLYLQINDLVKNFSFCPVQFDYDITNQPSLQLKHCFIAITREAFANIIRHSNATRVILRLREHPAMYQLIIQDNGKIGDSVKLLIAKVLENQDSGEGMGLSNIAERVKGFGGNINITTENGFKLFISIPKKIK